MMTTTIKSSETVKSLETIKSIEYINDKYLIDMFYKPKLDHFINYLNNCTNEDKLYFNTPNISAETLVNCYNIHIYNVIFHIKKDRLEDENYKLGDYILNQMRLYFFCNHCELFNSENKCAPKIPNTCVSCYFNLLMKKENDMCSICMEDLQLKITVETKCKHTFHMLCFTQLIENWKGGINNVPVCPLCRVSLADKILVRHGHNDEYYEADDYFSNDEQDDEQDDDEHYDE
jgi:hypothetical protein